MAAKKALGRGLNALFTPSSAPQQNQKTEGEAEVQKRSIESEIAKIPVGDIRPNRHQPRTHFDDSALSELAESIKTHGIAQPLMVTEKPEGGFELVLGERRLRAAKLAGLETVPCLIRKLSNRQRHELALVENMQREDLDPLEEALALDSLMREHGLTQDQASMAVGKSRSAVANTLRFLRLHEDVQQALKDREISEGHAKCLAGLSAHADQLRFLEKIKTEKWTVRDLESAISSTTPKKKSSSSKSSSDMGETQRIEEDLQRMLGRRVEIQSKGKKGWIRFAFYSPWDLDLLLKKLGLAEGEAEGGEEGNV